VYRTSTISCSSERRCRANPLEGYREKCSSETVLGTRFAKRPVRLGIPITIAGMSFGAPVGECEGSARGGAATEMGTSTTTGDGGMTAEERSSSKTLVYQCLPSRYGFNPDDLRKARRYRGCHRAGLRKPGGGGMLLGQKVSPRVAAMRTLPEGIDQRSASRHPDWTGPDDLAIKIKELREITDWQTPDLREGWRNEGISRREARSPWPAPMSLSLTVCRAELRLLSGPSSSMSAYPALRRSARLSMRSRT